MYIVLHLLFKKPRNAGHDMLPTIAVIGGSPSILDNKIFIAKAFAHPENKAPKLGVAFNFVLLPIYIGQRYPFAFLVLPYFYHIISRIVFVLFYRICFVSTKYTQ